MKLINEESPKRNVFIIHEGKIITDPFTLEDLTYRKDTKCQVDRVANYYAKDLLDKAFDDLKKRMIKGKCKKVIPSTGEMFRSDSIINRWILAKRDDGNEIDEVNFGCFFYSASRSWCGDNIRKFYLTVIFIGGVE